MDISVVLSTYNPVPAIFSWALDSIAHQTLPRDRFEVIIVDNNSAYSVADMAAVKNRPYPLRVVHEPRPGLVHARCCGIREAAADLLVFVDDDNHLDPDYLARAVNIAQENQSLGAFGGISRLLTDARPPEWMAPLLAYIAVRDYGPEVITSNENQWGKWEPIGAGMVVRKSVGLAFLNLVETVAMASQLGRSPKKLGAGEDTLLARAGYGLGYYCSYQPALKLTHFIRSSRLSGKSLFRTIEGIGRSYVVFETIVGGKTFRDDGWIPMWLHCFRCARERMRTRGFKTGFIESAWDLGYMRQVRECARLDQKRTSDAYLASHS